MEKIKITVCCGTTCFLMGSSDILALEEQIGSDLKDILVFEGSPCMDFCKSKVAGKAPFCLVNDELIASATPEKIRLKISQLLEKRAL